MRPSLLQTKTFALLSLTAGFGALLTPLAIAQTGADLYGQACAACHGNDGRGRTSVELGMTTPLPDFTDCNFASREPDADWGTVVHQGGPVRAFDRMMPAFGEALTQEEINAILLHIRGFCLDPNWPRGELNLPRALLTEKAFPEDEAVIEGNYQTGDNESYGFNFLWEQRFGARNQIEISLPIQRVDTGDPGGWVTGAGDLAVGVKHVLTHNLERNSIVAVGGEYILATGDEQRGLGKGTDVFESYIAWGKGLPNGSFVQLQGIAEFPLDSGFNDELILRAAVGKTLSLANPYGRAWTPMIEVQGKWEDESGADVAWDIVPQFQVTLSTRQHIMAATGVRLPVTNRSNRDPELVFYLLWEWFDGGILEGW